MQNLARMAEKIGQSDEFKLAEEVYRKIAMAPRAPFNPNKVMLIQFLASRRRFSAIVNVCESLRKNPADRGSVDRLCVALFADPAIPVVPEQVEQIKRLIGWYKEEARDGSQAQFYQMGLGALYERIGEDRVAEGYYRAIVDRDDRQGIASNNLAWLMALNSTRWNDALDLVNRAIRIGGPIPDFLDTKGVVYLKMGQNDLAIAQFTDAIKAAAIKGQPTATKYFHLAQAYLAKKDKENARKNLEAAMSKGPLPNGLHRYELASYQQVRNELGMP